MKLFKYITENTKNKFIKSISLIIILFEKNLLLVKKLMKTI